MEMNAQWNKRQEKEAQGRALVADSWSLLNEASGETHPRKVHRVAATLTARPKRQADW